MSRRRGIEGGYLRDKAKRRNMTAPAVEVEKPESIPEPPKIVKKAKKKAKKKTTKKRTK